MTTLQQIRTRFRDITATSEYQVTDAEVDDFINDYYTLDLAERLQLFSLKTEFKFFTSPYVWEYDLTDAAAFPGLNGNSVLNSYTSFEPPVYVGGYRATYFQDEGEFRLSFSENQAFKSAATGDGVATVFTFDLSDNFLLRSRVIVQTVDSTGNSVVGADDGAGIITGAGISGTVNYITASVTVTFSVAPASGQSIDAQFVEVRPARPVALLNFNNKFQVRPVPDTVYEVRVQAFRYLTQALADGEDPAVPQVNPEIASWWKLIAYGAALEYFAARRDTQSILEYRPIYQELEDQALYRQARQINTQRRRTIYDGGPMRDSNFTYYPYNGG